jgi:hypothetical protein
MLTPAVASLDKETKRLKGVFVKRKMDMDNHRDDICDIRRGLCAKMSLLFVATRHADLFDAE